MIDISTVCQGIRGYLVVVSVDTTGSIDSMARLNNFRGSE